MSRSIDDLQTRLNLCSDSYYENFCDVLTDNAVKVGTTVPIEPGEFNWFGNDCRLEAISHSSVDVTRNQEFLLKLIKPWDWDLSSLKLVHSCFLLHMQAEENIQIDIIWTLDPSDDQDTPFDYYGIAVFFEDSGEMAADGEPNFDPSNSGHWEEFLFDMGIGPDPYADDDE